MIKITVEVDDKKLIVIEEKELASSMNNWLRIFRKILYVLGWEKESFNKYIKESTLGQEKETFNKYIKDDILS